MALSRAAREHAAEIRRHDWSDAPYRADRAGHNRATDSNADERVLSPQETRRIKLNVMWVTAQVLGYQDPNFDVYEFAEACGLDIRRTSGGLNGGIAAGVRRDNEGRYHKPGTPPGGEPRPRCWETEHDMRNWHQRRGERVVEYQDVSTTAGELRFAPTLVEPCEPA